MDIICSSAGIVNPDCPGQGIMDIVNAGFDSVSLEIGMCCSGFELEHYGCMPKEECGRTLISENPSMVRTCFQKLVETCRMQHLQVGIVRTPYQLRDTRRTDLEEILAQISEACIELCGEVGCGFLVIPPLFAGISSEDIWRANRIYYLRLAAAARRNGVIILLENQCRDLNGHLVRGVCSDSAVTAEWIDELNREVKEERFGFCMDVGVCSLCGQDMHEFAVTMGRRMKAVVLRDCDGHHENSLLPFTCVHNGQPQTDWLSLIRGLRETGFDGKLILSMADTASSFSPLLRPSLLTFARAVAEYVRWQTGIELLLKRYPSIVLFGAGNMCRNYMKCYGEKYPPLFTCDNNQAVWGTLFCGLEVKPPEALKTIPGDCGVFICNIYYREIEKQLQDMGIRNIEFFNDEYMPSFYFDRLKGV